MFKKKPNVKPLAPLRSSDRRKLAEATIKDLDVQIPTVGEDETAPSVSAIRNSLFPEATRSAKFTTTAGPNLDTVNGTLYVAEDGRPLWVRMGDRTIFPTVYTLWNNPGLLPIVHTHPHVIGKLCGGADLMTPGLVGPPFPEGAKEGRLVAVASTEKPDVPLAVGTCYFDISSLEKAVGEKGKAVSMLHFINDEIFKQAGALAIVPEGLDISAVEDDMENLKMDNGEENKAEEGVPQPSAEDEIRELEQNEIDKAFHDAVLYGIQDHAAPEKLGALDFPLSASGFMSIFVQPYLPAPAHFPPHNLQQTASPHPDLHIKKSTWKNANKFIKQLEKETLLKTKTRGGGEMVVLSVDPTRHAVERFRPYRLPSPPKENKEASGDSGNSGPSGSSGFQIGALYRPNGKALKFFEAMNANTKDFYNPGQIKQMLNTYIEREHLPVPSNRRLVQLDPLLTDILFKSTNDPAYKPRLAREVLLERLYAGCSAYHTITTAAGTSKPKAGPPPQVSVIIEKRQGNKTVTRVMNLEPFGVDPKGLAEELQRVCAGSATVGQAVGLKPGLLEVLVQGTQTAAVQKVLEKRGLEKRLIGVTDKTKKGRK